MKRFGTRSATGKMVKLKLPVDVESLLIEASNRSGRSRSFEAVIRLKDHLHRYPKFNRAGNIYGKSLVKYLGRSVAGKGAGHADGDHAAPDGTGAVR